MLSLGLTLSATVTRHDTLHTFWWKATKAEWRFAATTHSIAARVYRCATHFLSLPLPRLLTLLYGDGLRCGPTTRLPWFAEATCGGYHLTLRGGHHPFYLHSFSRLSTAFAGYLSRLFMDGALLQTHLLRLHLLPPSRRILFPRRLVVGLTTLPAHSSTTVAWMGLLMAASVPSYLQPPARPDIPLPWPRHLRAGPALLRTIVHG